MKILIFGIQGQLGRDLELALSDHEIVPMLYEEVDITSRPAVDQAVAAAKPDWVINSAAKTHVEKCETEEASAFAVNAVGARYAALAAAAAGARLIHLSTDYVFDGGKGEPYVETDEPHPINMYGASKFAGELLVREACPSHYILRTSGLYGVHECLGKGTNFVETMFRLAAEKDELTVVNDEVLTPTFSEDLAGQIRALINDPPGFGIYHATNEGSCSWFEVASEIFARAGLSVSLSPIPSSQWPTPTRRPANSTLENAALKKAGLNRFPDWRDALGRYLAKRPGS